MRVSDKYSQRLNRDIKKLSRQRDTIKTVFVKRKSAILMDTYKHLQNKADILKKSQTRCNVHIISIISILYVHEVPYVIRPCNLV